MKVLAMLLVPSLALAQPAPILQLRSEPSSPVMALPAGGYSVLPADPVDPSHGRRITGGIVVAGGIAVAVLGGLLIASRPDVPPMSSPGWYDAQTSSMLRGADGGILLTAGLVTALGGAYMIAAPGESYGEAPGAPNLTF